MTRRAKVIPESSVVLVKAACGHHDVHLLGPGDHLQIDGQFSLCDACQKLPQVHPEKEE